MSRNPFDPTGILIGFGVGHWDAAMENRRRRAEAERRREVERQREGEYPQPTIGQTFRDDLYRATLGDIERIWPGLLMFAAIFCYATKYVVADLFNHYDPERFYLNGLYWELVWRFSEVALFFFVLQLLFARTRRKHKRSFIRFVRGQAIATVLTFAVLSPILCTGLFLGQHGLRSFMTSEAGKTYGPVFQLDWWQLGELAVAGKTCTIRRRGDFKDVRGACWVGYRAADARYRVPADELTQTAAWYSFF